jgi:hypothetical protein
VDFDHLAAHAIGGSELGSLEESSRAAWERWRGTQGPPVPVIIDALVWKMLIDCIAATPDPSASPRVVRLFMRRGQPRQVVAAANIETVWRNERGVLRWNEGGYPPLTAALRKGGNAFVRGDVDLSPHDAWWMGREQTDLRLLFDRKPTGIVLAAWWARGGTSGLASAAETDGEPWPVRILVGPAG